MPIVKLTARNVISLPAGAGRIDYTDELQPGFVLRVSETGARTYAVRYRLGEDIRRVTLGPVHRLDLADARRKAKDILGRVARGEDPAAEKAEARRVEAEGGATLQALGDRLIAEAELGERTRYAWRSVFRVHVCSTLGDRDPATITRGDVRELLDGVAERAPSQANEALKVLRWILARAFERELIPGNVCAGMRKPRREVPRDRVTTHAELRGVWNATEGAGLYGRAIRLLILTGARREEVFGARWSEFDREAEVWRIPAGRTKNARAHTVPMVEALTVELDALADATGAGEWLFPGRGERALLPTSKAWGGLLVAAGIEEAAEDDQGEAKDARQGDERNAEPRRPKGRRPKPAARHTLTVHDLRRTFRNALTAELGIAPHVAEALIGHAPGKLIATYAPSGVPLKDKRRALEAWARHLTHIIEAKPAEKVSRMPARTRA